VFDHHNLFDKGVLGVTDPRRVTVSVHFVGRSEAAELLVVSLISRVSASC
jgi:putative restriction endonuclease